MAVINGLGTATPPFGLGQSQASGLAAVWGGASDRHRDVLRRLYARSGVTRRASCLARAENDDLGWFYGTQDECGPSTADRMRQFERFASPLASRATTRAVDAAGLEPADITHLVCVTCTGFAAPAVEREIIRRTGLRLDVQRLQVGFMGCHGALNGLQIAAALATADPAARVLLVAFELCSLHFQYGWHPDRVVPNALFADGAAAAVISGERRGLAIEQSASLIVPDTTEDMTWRIGDHGFEMHLSSSVPELLADAIRPWLDERLHVRGVTVGAVEQWAIHAGGPRIVKAVADRLELPNHAVADSLAVLSAHGNMSSATVLFVLERQWGQPGRSVALGFGPGLAIELVQFGWLG